MNSIVKSVNELYADNLNLHFIPCIPIKWDYPFNLQSLEIDRGQSKFRNSKVWKCILHLSRLPATLDSICAYIIQMFKTLVATLLHQIVQVVVVQGSKKILTNSLKITHVDALKSTRSQPLIKVRGLGVGRDPPTPKQEEVLSRKKFGGQLLCSGLHSEGKIEE